MYSKFLGMFMFHSHVQLQMPSSNCSLVTAGQTKRFMTISLGRHVIYIIKMWP